MQSGSHPTSCRQSAGRKEVKVCIVMTMPLLYSHFKTLVLQNLNWIGDHYFEMAVAGGEEDEVEDQQTADAILSINYRDKVGQI